MTNDIIIAFMNNLIKKNPFKINNLIPCSNISCLCAEYLDFSKIKHIQLYKNCISNGFKKNGVFDTIPYTDFYKQNVL